MRKLQIWMKKQNMFFFSKHLVTWFFKSSSLIFVITWPSLWRIGGFWCPIFFLLRALDDEGRACLFWGIKILQATQFNSFFKLLTNFLDINICTNKCRGRNYWKRSALCERRCGCRCLQVLQSHVRLAGQLNQSSVDFPVSFFKS